jgi:hypothetical protein
MDVFEKLKQVGICIHKNRLVAAAEERPVVTVTAIETLRVNAVDMSHDSCDIAGRRLNKKVIMIGEQAIGGYSELPHLARVLYDGDKMSVVLLVEIDELRSSPPVDDVIPGIGKFDSKRSGHVITLGYFDRPGRSHT